MYKFREYNQSTDQESWSPTSKRRFSHRVFTDSTEKQAVEQYETKYNTNKPRDTNDLAALLMMQ